MSAIITPGEIAARAAMKPVCDDPAACCRSLSSVWLALGVEHYTGRSVVEEVLALRAKLAAVEALRPEAELLLDVSIGGFRTKQFLRDLLAALGPQEP